MEIRLNADQAAFIEKRVLDGRFANADEAVWEAISLLKQHEILDERAHPTDRKSLAQLFMESPFRGLDLEFPRDKTPLRVIDL